MVIALVACRGAGLTVWSDGFEDYEEPSEVLALGGDWGWSEQVTLEENGWSLVDDMAFEGDQAVHFHAGTASGTTSKASLFVNDMRLAAGSTVSLQASYFLPSDAGRPFLLDLEEDVLVGAGPGIRIWPDEDGALMIERKKMVERDVRQEPSERVAFPRDVWVTVRLDVHLTQRKQGWIELYQDDELVLQVLDTQTLPRDHLYFIQGTQGSYSNVEFGITAVGEGGPMDLWMDEVSVRTQ